MIEPILAIAGVVALVAGPVFLMQSRERARSRRAHLDAATTHLGRWAGRVDTEALEWLFPEVRVGFIKGLFLSEGAPVELEVSVSSLRLHLTSRLLRAQAPAPWEAPWSEVLLATEDGVGFSGLGGSITLVRMTDLTVLLVGAAAQPFLEDLGFDDEDLMPTSVEEVREWQELLNPHWRPWTAVLEVRMSAPEGAVGSISFRARGVAPAS